MHFRGNVNCCNSSAVCTHTDLQWRGMGPEGGLGGVVLLILAKAKYETKQSPGNIQSKYQILSLNPDSCKVSDSLNLHRGCFSPSAGSFEVCLLRALSCLCSSWWGTFLSFSGLQCAPLSEQGCASANSHILLICIRGLECYCYADSDKVVLEKSTASFLAFGHYSPFTAGNFYQVLLSP